jgi:hypothetical protein
MLFMKKALVAGLAFVACSVYADRYDSDYGLVFEGAFQLGSYTEDGFDTLSPSALSLRLEKPLTNFLSLRADYAFGVDSDETERSGVVYDLELKKLMSGFLKGRYSTSDILSVYVLLGFSKGEFSTEASGIVDTASDSSMSYGLGGTYQFDTKTALSVEYISYFSGDSASYSGVNVGLSQSF